ncbi:MAG: hypothetical protein FJ245_02200 [Nitrospira sp.]|nr:hypothetical protein [Nitrospira sp.]
MIIVTHAAIDKLKALLMEHPEEQVVRITVKDLDDHRLTFGLTLEEAAQADDVIQVIEGLTVVTQPQSAQRMDGMTVDYGDAAGFKFLHPSTPEDLTWRTSSMN